MKDKDIKKDINSKFKTGYMAKIKKR